MIDITGVNLADFAKKVYELSRPQGMGFLHYQPKPLTDDEANNLVKEDGRWPLDMDYVNGRACKMTVFRDGDKLHIHDNWYDHSSEQLNELLSAFNIPNIPIAV